MMKVLWITCLALLCLQSCGQKNSGNNLSLSPELESVFDDARSTKNVRSLLVSHRGQLIAEEYFAPFSRDSLEHVRSVTKSVMTTLIGIAIDKGIITGIDDSIVKYLDEEAKGKEDVTIKHLLTMTSGIAWREVMGNMEIDEWINSASPVNYVLDKSFDHSPGTTFEYSTGIIHLLSVILSNAAGMSTLEFAQRNLFEPLGIEKVKWQLLNDGYYHGGSRLQLKPRDMLKFGQLFDDEGMYNGKRIVSADFVKEAVSLHADDAVSEEGKGYGYGWWTGTENGLRLFFASGYGGQTILVAPDHDIVIVITYKWKVSNQMASDQQTEALNRFGAGVMKAMLKM